MQSEAAECGLACLAMVLNYLGANTSLSALRTAFPTSQRGTSLGKIAEFARSLHVHAQGFQLTPKQLGQLRTPAILHWNERHFVVLASVGRSKLRILDPARGDLSLSHEEAAMRFSGVALELVAEPDFRPTIAPAPRLGLLALIRTVRGIKGPVLQSLGLALLVELVTLTLPFQAQWIVDHALVAGDTHFLGIVVAGFLLLLGFQLAVAIARGYVTSWIGASVNAHWTTSVFDHLLHLPLRFFASRHVGDITSRFSSLRSIQNSLTGGTIEALLDGVTSILLLVVIVVYRAGLALVPVAAVAAYVSMRWLLFAHLRRLDYERVHRSARLQSELLESVRGIQTLKLANKEGSKSHRFAAQSGDLGEQDMRSQRMVLSMMSVGRWLGTSQHTLVLGVGAWLCLQGQMTAGMLIAFVAYSDQFATRLTRFIDTVLEFRMLRLHSDRVGEIVLEELEPSTPGAFSLNTPPQISVENVWFRYSPNDPWVLRDLTLTICEGEYVAITGPSGCGKSTLAKLLLGLIEPSSGVIRVRGEAMSSLMRHGLRERTASVMQDDHLFAGTIAENISFFDADMDLDRVKDAARAASIHEIIVEMPMQYQSLIGERAHWIQR